MLPGAESGLKDGFLLYQGAPGYLGSWLFPLLLLLFVARGPRVQGPCCSVGYQGHCLLFPKAFTESRGIRFGQESVKRAGGLPRRRAHGTRNIKKSIRENEGGRIKQRRRKREGNRDCFWKIFSRGLGRQQKRNLRDLASSKS